MSYRHEYLAMMEREYINSFKTDRQYQIDKLQYLELNEKPREITQQDIINDLLIKLD